jgi:glyoxylase-like metal-dependent hydrolase (beta-lactamase superfamily II)
MQLSDIAVISVLCESFQEQTYIVHQKGNNDCLVIDPGLDDGAIAETLQRSRLNPVAVLITHGHGDHIAGIPVVKSLSPSCKVYAGELDNEKLTDAHKNLSASFGFDLTVGTADVLLRDGAVLELAGIRIEVRHVPGHSKGHVVYYIAAEPKGLLFSGDVIFRGSIGRSDFPDGDPAVQIPAIEKQILSLPDSTVIYPGHGATTTVGEEKRTNPFLYIAIFMGIFGPRVGQGPLFDEVCQYHELDKKVKTLLQSVIKKYQPPRPVEIFILPDILCTALADADFADSAGDLQKLHDTWFQK